MKTLLLSFAAAILLATSAAAAPLASRVDDDRWERKSDRDHDHDRGPRDDKRYDKKGKDKKYQDRRGYDNRRDNDKCQRDGRYGRDDQKRRNDQYGYGRREPVKRFPGR
ncbi:hypothetical protein [Hymenobacter canadensis]|uniref:Uncharacterized protein n=1 Tax=Hymenobacter canadensis TaxID=2999067 RepID=A0ABY7LUH2_9BACT|nr:hypothetical protein [Hymenobacter canadensis]WBA43514.1 hypothetical protein O3303_08075 [Hymenobacter canadensis]